MANNEHMKRWGKSLAKVQVDVSRLHKTDLTLMPFLQFQRSMIGETGRAKS